MENYHKYMKYKKKYLESKFLSFGGSEEARDLASRAAAAAKKMSEEFALPPIEIDTTERVELLLSFLKKNNLRSPLDKENIQSLLKMEEKELSNASEKFVSFNYDTSEHPFIIHIKIQIEQGNKDDIENIKSILGLFNSKLNEENFKIENTKRTTICTFVIKNLQIEKQLIDEAKQRESNQRAAEEAAAEERARRAAEAAAEETEKQARRTAKQQEEELKAAARQQEEEAAEEQARIAAILAAEEAKKQELERQQESKRREEEHAAEERARRAAEQAAEEQEELERQQEEHAAEERARRAAKQAVVGQLLFPDHPDYDPKKAAELAKERAAERDAAAARAAASATEAPQGLDFKTKKPK